MTKFQKSRIRCIGSRNRRKAIARVRNYLARHRWGPRPEDSAAYLVMAEITSYNFAAKFLEKRMFRRAYHHIMLALECWGPTDNHSKDSEARALYWYAAFLSDLFEHVGSPDQFWKFVSKPWDQNPRLYMGMTEFSLSYLGGLTELEHELVLKALTQGKSPTWFLQPKRSRRPSPISLLAAVKLLS